MRPRPWDRPSTRQDRRRSGRSESNRFFEWGSGVLASFLPVAVSRDVRRNFSRNRPTCQRGPSDGRAENLSRFSEYDDDLKKP